MPLFQNRLDPFADFYRVRYLYPRNSGQSGAGASAAIDTGGANCNSGTATSGYGRVNIASMITNVGATSGAAIDYDCPISLAVIGAFNTSDANHLARIIVGGNSGVPVVASSNALTAKGFGVEFSFQNSRTECRLFCHDGTTYSTSAYNGAAIGDALGVTFLILSSDALGNIALEASYKTSNSYLSLEGPPKPSTILTLAGGPTGLGSGATGFIDIAAINSSAIAPAAGATCRTQYHLLKLGL
jgi:hypothetical protein